MSSNVHYVTLPQADHGRRLLPQNRQPDIIFEAASDAPGSDLGIPLVELPGTIDELEPLHRMRDPDQVVYYTDDRRQVVDLWLVWPGYNSKRAISWRVISTCDPAGITRKEFAIEIRALLMSAFEKFERQNETGAADAYQYPVGFGEGQISPHHVVVTKAYHIKACEWQVEIRLRSWP
ncbi:hypothetical protein CVT24_012757 [Panaeolus cyanescens]|uniref:Uncharacterized protein n=1 Tax=Panaeolus cyanescens TaxID=181874 RepID=A0A409YJR8_9AGAR|nr:hypothetical protein CVT24_012757 [Panaeolus cyanescens]